MTGSPPSSPQGRSLREAVLVGTSLVVALALGWAGWLVGHGPDELAEAEVASTARVVARDVRSQWESLRASGDFRTFSDGSIEAVEAARARLEAAGAASALPTLAEAPDSPRAFVALFREAERLARRGSVQDSQDALADALEAGPLAEDEPALRWLDWLLADASGDPAVETAAWDRLVAEVDWNVTRDGRPLRLVAGWVAASDLDATRAQALRRSVAEEGAPFIIGAASPSDRVYPERGAPRLEVDPETAATLTLSDSVWPGIGAELRATPAWAARTKAALSRVLDPIHESRATADWSITATPLGLAALREGESPFLVDPTELPTRLQRELGLQGDFSLWIKGITLDVSGSGTTLDTFTLPGLDRPVHLQHQDPERLVRAGAQRRRISAWLLLTLGVVVVAASLVAARALRRERRLAELRSTFVAGISHDLRTPLASILLMADNLRSGRIGQERTIEYATGISGEAERLRRRVDDILDFARIERGEGALAHREETDLPALALDILDTSRELAENAGFEFTGKREELPPSADLDADALRRIIGNLVQNSLRHSGGTQLFVGLACRRDELLVEVRDNGRGIPAKDRGRVLIAFQQLEPGVHTQGGTGLGLTIVSGLVGALGGTLQIDAGPDGQGAAFHVSIPLHSTHP